MSTQALSAATQDRKARLAQLKSLKRKQAPDSEPAAAATDEPSTTAANDDDAESAEDSRTAHYLSGRNYDAATRGPKLGFETAPDAGQDTVEARAAALALEERTARDAAAADDAPLDLAKLAPKRANWDLKKALKEANAVLDVRTENAFARKLRAQIAERDAGAEVDVAGVVGELEREDGAGAESAW